MVRNVVLLFYLLVESFDGGYQRNYSRAVFIWEARRGKSNTRYLFMELFDLNYWIKAGEPGTNGRA